MIEKRAQEILNAINNGQFLIRVKYIRADIVISARRRIYKRSFKLSANMSLFVNQKRVGGKYVRVDQRKQN